MCWSSKPKPMAVDEDWEPPQGMSAFGLTSNDTWFDNVTGKTDDILQCNFPAVACDPSSKFARGYCENGGICCHDNGLTFCVCEHAWSGNRCDDPFVQQSTALPAGYYGVIITVILLAIVVIAVVVVFVVCRLKKNRSQRRPKADRESGYEQLNMQRADICNNELKPKTVQET